MGAPYDADLGPEYHIYRQRQELSCADIDAICEEEAQRVDLERVRKLISLYERLRDSALKDSANSLDVISGVSLRNQANTYQQVVKDLRSVIR